MTREELFRGKVPVEPKNEFSDTWVYGDLIYSGGKRYIHPQGNLVKVDGALGRIIIMHEVVPETIGRYTRLTDKNGERIFEGDIVALKESHQKNSVTGIVKFGRYTDVDSVDDYDYLGWYIEIRGKCVSILQPQADNIEIEIIGNIHDNPELREGGHP